MTNKIFIDNKDSKFSLYEYERLNNELLERMRGIFTHGFTLISMVGLLWTITATLMSNFHSQESTNGFDEAQLIFAGLIVFLFGVPVVVLYPFSVKYRDNLRVISSLSAYIKVFYEFPMLLGKYDHIMIDENNNKIPFKSRMGWESTHCSAKYGIKRLFGFEYGCAAIVSSILSLLSFIHFYTLTKFSYEYIAFFVCSLIYLIFLTFVTVIICFNSRTTKPLNDYSEEYFLLYLSEAEKTNLMSNDEVRYCIKHQIINIVRDTCVSENLSSRKKSIKQFFSNKKKNINKKTSVELYDDALSNYKKYMEIHNREHFS